MESKIIKNAKERRDGRDASCLALRSRESYSPDNFISDVTPLNRSAT